MNGPPGTGKTFMLSYIGALFASNPDLKQYPAVISFTVKNLTARHIINYYKQWNNLQGTYDVMRKCSDFERRNLDIEGKRFCLDWTVKRLIQEQSEDIREAANLGPLGIN